LINNFANVQQQGSEYRDNRKDQSSYLRRDEALAVGERIRKEERQKTVERIRDKYAKK
jgi:gamma-glutamyltranspeptidase